MTVSEHIAHLLEHHECVIIPDFGGFLVKNSSANYAQEQLLFYPPSAVTQFHIHLQNNDGLLIQSIMEEDDCSYGIASQKVTAFIKERKAQLKETKSTILPGVGKIYLDEEDKVLFKPNRDSNFNQESFGLEPIVAERINRVEQVEQKVVREIERRKRNPVALTFTVAASILALFLASALFFLHNGNENQQQFVKASLGDILKPVTERIIEKDAEILEKYRKTEEEFAKIQENYPIPSRTICLDGESNEIHTDKSINTPANNSNESTIQPVNDSDEFDEKVTSPSSATEINTIATATPDNADFRVVIGMFEDESNAQKRYQEALDKGYTNVQLKHGRRYHRVVIPYTNEEATWKEAVAEVKATIEPEAWIWETLYQ